MKKTLIALSILTIGSPAMAFPLLNIPGIPNMSLVSPTLSLNFGQASPSIVLLVPTKDPYTAYQLGSIPLVGSYCAANYVGMDPLRAVPDATLVNAANHHFWSDFLFLAAGVLIPAIALQTGASRETMAASLGAGIAIGLGGVMIPRTSAYPSFFAQKAVEFNQRQYEAFGYKPWFVPTPQPTLQPQAPKGQAPTAP